MWLVKNLTDNILPIPPAVQLKPGEIRRLFAVSGDYLDRDVQNGNLAVYMDGNISDYLTDNLGAMFSPGACVHTYTNDANGNMLTDTAVELFTNITRVKTFTYVGGAAAAAGAAMLTQSVWVQQ